MGDAKVEKPSCNKEEEDQLQTVLKSWNITKCNYLNANCDLEDEETLERLMKDYCEGLEKIVLRTVDLEALQKKVLVHIRVLHIYYTQVNSLKARDIYLNNMEHIMKISCNMELHILKVKKKPLFMRKREFKEMLVLKCTKSIIHALNAFLLGDECHIAHVLMHLNDIEKSPLSKDVCNYLFHHFLVENAPKDLSVESYCRYYILFCKWKEITQRDDKKKSFDRLLSKMFPISSKTLEGNELWREISQPPKPTMVEKVMEKFHPSVAKCVTYFDYFNRETVMKVENFEKTSSADGEVNQTSIYDPSKSLQEIKNIANKATVIDLCDDADDDVEFISAEIPNPVCIIDDDEIDHTHDDEDIEFVSRIRIVKETSFLKAISIGASKRNSKQARKEIVSGGETDITSYSASDRESFLDSIDISSSIEMCSTTNMTPFLDSITVPEIVPGTNTISFLDPVTTPEPRPFEEQAFSFENAAELHDSSSSPNIEETVSSETVYSPKIVTEQPVTVIEGPLAMTEQPVTVLEEPQIVAEQPVTVIEEPLVISEQPIAVMEQPDTITEQPMTLIEQTGIEALPNTVFKYISYLTQHISLSVQESRENVTPSEMVLATEILQPPRSPTHTSSITYNMNMLVDCVEKMQRAHNEKTAIKIKIDNVQTADTSSTVTFAKEDSVSETNSENCAEFRTTCILTENHRNSSLYTSPSDNQSPKASFCGTSEAPNVSTSTLTKLQNPNLTNINEFIDETPDGIDLTEFDENIRLATRGSSLDAATNTEDDDIESLNIENQLLSDNYEPEQIRQKLVIENQLRSDESVMTSSEQDIISTDSVSTFQERKDNDVPSLDTGCTKEPSKAYENIIDTGQKEFKIKPCLIYLKRDIENRIAKSFKEGTENHLKSKESKKRIKVKGSECTDLGDSKLLNSRQAVKRQNSSVCNNFTYNSENNGLKNNSEKSVVKLNKTQKHVRFEDIVDISSERKSSQRKHKMPLDCGHLYKRSLAIKTDNNINNKNDSFAFNNQFFKPYNNIMYDNSLFTSENSDHDSKVLIVKPKKKQKHVRFEDVKTTRESKSTDNSEMQKAPIDSAQAYGHYHKSQADITKRSSKPDDKKSEFVKVEYDKTTTNINAKDTVAVIQGDQQQTYPLQNNSNKRTGSYIAYRSQGKLSVSKRTSGLTLDQFEIYLATQGASERKRVYRKATKESPSKTTAKRVKTSNMSKNHKAEIDKLLKSGVYISTPFRVDLG